jgi:hypothetical protein
MYIIYQINNGLKEYYLENNNFNNKFDINYYIYVLIYFFL